MKESPCIRQCCLDNFDICVGCFRHIDEICGWHKFSDLEKENVLKYCQTRKIDHTQKQDGFSMKTEK